MNGPADHVPVLVEEVVRALVRGAGGVFLDGTLGLARHASAILEAAGPGGRLLGVDADPGSVELASERLAPYGERAVALRGDFTELAALAQARGWTPADGVFIDLGLSSWLIESSGRGFSFQKDEPLDMRFDVTRGRTAEDVLNREPRESLLRILRDYGEEPLAARLAERIVDRRERARLTSTADLRSVVLEAVPRGKIEKTLARVFQAIRIAVNEELDKLRLALPRLVRVLRPGG